MYSEFWFRKVVHGFRAPCRPDFCIFPNIFSTIIAGFNLHTKMCTVLHAPSGMRQITVRFAGVTPKLWGPQYATGFTSPFWPLEFGTGS